MPCSLLFWVDTAQEALMFLLQLPTPAILAMAHLGSWASAWVSVGIAGDHVFKKDKMSLRVKVMLFSSWFPSLFFQ